MRVATEDYLETLGVSRSSTGSDGDCPRLLRETHILALSRGLFWAYHRNANAKTVEYL